MTASPLVQPLSELDGGRGRSDRASIFANFPPLARKVTLTFFFHAKITLLL